MVNLVVRSTRVPIAERFRPMVRSPSQCPGTARSSASMRPFADHYLGCDMAARTLSGASTRDAQRPPGAQAGDQLPLESTTALDVERLVDRLVRDAHGLIIGEIQPQPVRELLRTPRH